MNPNDSTAIWIAVIALLSAVLAPTVTGFLNQQQERKKAHHDYISSIVNALIDLRGELQYYQILEWELRNGATFAEIAVKKEFQPMQTAFGKVYAIMISVDIKEIRVKAPIVMASIEEVMPSAKLEALDFALKRLGEEYDFFKK